MSLYSEEGGDGADLLVLLHGLGSTGAVWTPLREFIDARWRGRWWQPDLPGHGRSARASGYSVEESAHTLGLALGPRVRPAGRLVILGHSLGGAIGLALASGRFGVQPSVVFGVGIKLLWTDEDLQRMQTLAAQPAKQFAAEKDAWERYLKVSGLAELASTGSAVAARGIVEDGQRWRLAMDPVANGVGKPAFAALAAAARCPVHLARGGRDALVTLDQTRELDSNATDLGTSGHNVMVESPQALWAWLEANGACSAAQ
jgi:pimeloyl-ACP methyl ester carboxylesterase